MFCLDLYRENGLAPVLRKGPKQSKYTGKIQMMVYSDRCRSRRGDGGGVAVLSRVKGSGRLPPEGRCLSDELEGGQEVLDGATEEYPPRRGF